MTLVEYLRDIANSLREVKRDYSKINAMEFANEIRKLNNLSGSSGYHFIDTSPKNYNYTKEEIINE